MEIRQYIMIGYFVFGIIFAGAVSQFISEKEKDENAGALAVFFVVITVAWPIVLLGNIGGMIGSYLNSLVDKKNE